MRLHGQPKNVPGEADGTLKSQPTLAAAHATTMACLFDSRSRRSCVERRKNQRQRHNSRRFDSGSRRPYVERRKDQRQRRNSPRFDSKRPALLRRTHKDRRQRRNSLALRLGRQELLRRMRNLGTSKYNQNQSKSFN
ncbi:MAG TPA: hypothetical protein VHC69_05545 [Polyangiaceae bacterium]|nr:hypothetical protein [Polyangiaceae bacterium]